MDSEMKTRGLAAEKLEQPTGLLQQMFEFF
jgi:hypothetical protein